MANNGNAVFQVRGDTAANWTTVNPTLLVNEFGFETDTSKFKVGDGVKAWADLAYWSGGYNTIRSGTVDPVGTVGLDGDFYINTTTSKIFGPKTAGAWGTGTALKGTNGTNGTNGLTVRSGTTDPAAALGVDGDFYINTTTSKIFGPKTAGAWGAGTSLVGPQGPPGSSGAWGSITGTLSAQTDLQTALDAKAGLAGGNAFTGTQTITGASALMKYLIPTGQDGRFEFYVNSVIQGGVSGTLNETRLYASSATGVVNLKVATTNRLTANNTGVLVTGTLGVSGNLTAANLSGTNTGDETKGTIDAKLGLPNDATKFYRGDGTWAVPAGNGGAAVDDTAYDATSWNGVTATAPSKNAVRDKFESLPVFASGTWTPTITNVSGLTLSQAYSCLYQRIGDMVSISGQIMLRGVGLVEARISLPVATNFTSAFQGYGVAALGTTNGLVAKIVSNAASDQLHFSLNSDDTSNVYTFTAMYQVL